MMKTILAIAITLLGFAACKNAGNRSQTHITADAYNNKAVPADKFKALISTSNSNDVIDVRTAAEYEQGHIPGATNFDWQSQEFNGLIASLDKAKPVYIYCQRGGRSAEAAEAMRNAGFQNVIELEGGMTAWAGAGFETEGPGSPKKPTGITPEAFQQMLKTDKYVLVDFSAKWCGPCKKVTPMVRQIAIENSNVQLIEIDVDDNDLLANSMNINAIPLLHIYKNGKLHWQHVGLISKKEVLENFN